MIKFRFTLLVPLLLWATPMGLAGCALPARWSGGARQWWPAAPASLAQTPAGELSPAARSRLLRESWAAYRQRFIQADGRVIDWETPDRRSTSEGQAYAMLRAVWMNDPDTFARTLQWGEDNLRRRQPGGAMIDSLWAWHWGQDAPTGNWQILDQNFASDGDIDAITALILAARQWHRDDYRVLARQKLADLWAQAVMTVNGKPYLLPGPAAAFHQNDTIIFNPSYLAPAAFRLFAQVDPERDWLALVNSSYDLLTKAAQVSSVSLPSDWIVMETKTGRLRVLGPTETLQSRYSFDAFRVWWRLALDAVWFNAPEADRLLHKQLSYLEKLWRSQQMIPARLDLQGKSLVSYESTAQYGMLYAGFQRTDPRLAQEIYQQKLAPVYQDGFWDNDAAYYTQNLVWFGLIATAEIPPTLTPNP